MYWQKRFNRENPNQKLEEEIKLIFFENNKSYGYRRITSVLKSNGHIINHKKVRRIMLKLNLKVVSFTRKSRRYNSYKGSVGKVAKNLIHRRFYTSIPHQKLTTDTTEFKYYHTDKQGNLTIKKLYLDPYLDMFNSEIISYSISEKPSA